MSNIIGAIARINTGKVEYVVAEQNEDGTYNLKGEKSNRNNIAAENLVIVREADVEHATVEAIETAMNAPQDTLDAETVQAIAAHVEDPNADDTFDPREDRRQSAYGLAILNALLRKNPRSGMSNTNPLKPIGSKRPKVRAKLKAERTAYHAVGRRYNEAVRLYGQYTPNAA